MSFIPKESGCRSRTHRGTGEKDARFASRNARLNGSRILVVEDEFIIAMEIQGSLEEAGATVVGPAYTVESALAMLDHETISAAIVDLRLGRDSATPVAAALAERHIPFVFYTGQPPGDPIRCAWPETGVLAKPASGEEIVQAIAGILY